MKTIKIEQETEGFKYQIFISKKNIVYKLKFEEDKVLFK